MKPALSCRWSCSAAICLAATSFFSGCATLINGTQQTVGIQTDPPGATCSIGAFKVVTPAAITLRRHDCPYTVSCELAGFSPATDKIACASAPWSGGNIFFGVVPGLVVDAFSGGDRALDPDSVTIPLRKKL